jgi:hypothetical protein
VTTQSPPEDESEENPKLEGKMFRLKREAIVAFDILKARQGPRSGPRLMAEAIDLLLKHYNMEPIEKPPTPPATPAKKEEDRPRAMPTAAPPARRG